MQISGKGHPTRPSSPTLVLLAFLRLILLSRSGDSPLYCFSNKSLSGSYALRLSPSPYRPPPSKFQIYSSIAFSPPPSPPPPPPPPWQKPESSKHRAPLPCPTNLPPLSLGELLRYSLFPSTDRSAPSSISLHVTSSTSIVLHRSDIHTMRRCTAIERA